MARRKHADRRGSVRVAEGRHVGTHMGLRTEPRALAFAIGTALLPFTVAQTAYADVTANTLPTGGQYVYGSGSIAQQGANKLQITQTTENGTVNWNSFSIGSSGWVNFTQPSASSVTLNRVLGNNPSEIFGRMTANGQVFLSNPNGVLFAPGASVDVGALFATTLTVSDQDAMAGRYTKWTNPGNSGAVINQGNIITADGYTALAGPQVRNDGVIVAHAGSVTLAAGDQVSLDMIGDGLIKVSVDEAALNASAINTGSIQADGGNVLLTARSANALLDTVVNNSGVIRANSLVETNGEIVLDGGTAGVVSNTGSLQAAGVDAGTTGGTVKVVGQYVGLFDGTKIDVRGDAGGGTALIGGNFHGAGPEQNASQTYVAGSASINANAEATGNGGQIAVWSNDATKFYGSITARGGSQGGDGGFVEVSGKQNLDYRGYVDARAPAGSSGTLLLDPTEITIDSGANQSTAQLLTDGTTVTGTGPFSDTATVPATGGTLTDGTINTQLGTANVTVTTSSGDIVISNATGAVAIGPATANSNTLTLNSAANISWSSGWSYANNGQLNLYAAAGTISGTGALAVGGTSPVLMQASSGIGSSISPILTTGLSQLAAKTATGGIFVSNSTSGNVTITSLTNPVTATAINGLDVVTSGDISLVNSAGNININQAVSTPSTAATAVVLSAGDGTAAGTTTGGDLTVGGSGSISIGGGGTAQLFTGSISGSAGLTALVGSGSGHFRYDSTPTAPNYALALSTGTSAIYREQPTLTITADNKGPITYGDATPAYTTSVIGLQNGDTAVQALSTAATVTDDNAKSTSGNLTAGSHTLTAAGGTDQLGYALNYATGTLTINPLALTGASIAASSSTYGSSLTAGAVTFANVVGTDAVNSAATVDTSTLSTSGKPIAGTYTQTASTTLTGADAGNYTFAGFTSGANYTINPLALTVASIAASSSTYGSPLAPGLVTLNAGVIGTDVVSSSATVDTSTLSTSGKPIVGTYTQTASTLSGTDAANYTLTPFTTGTQNYTINPAALTISGITAANKIYDGNTSATTNTSGAVYTGLVTGDLVAVSATGTFSDKDVGTGKTVSLVSGYTGADVANYSITNQTTTTANITQLGSVAWTGAGGDSLWSNASNWAGNAIPDKANVANVDLSGATVTFDATVPTLSGSVQISNLSNGTLNINSSALAIGSNLNLAGYNQTGGAVSTGGSFTVTNNFSQSAGTIASTGLVDITQGFGALSPLNVTSSNTVTLTANTPSGDITLEPGGSLSGNTVTLNAGRDVALNGAISGATVNINFGQQVAGVFTPKSTISGTTTVTGGTNADLFDFTSAPSITATLAGGSGRDKLEQTGGKTWNLDNTVQNSGTSGTLTWSSIEDLQDTGAGVFNMGTAGSVSGALVAVGGTVNYGSYATPVTFSLSDVAGGSTGITDIWTGIKFVTGSAATTDTITGTGTYTITASDAGNNGTVFWTSFENLNGGGASTLEATSATWNLTGSNAGTVTNLSGAFSGMANLADLGTGTFNMGTNGAVSGTISGGTSGIVNYASYATPVSFNIAGGSSTGMAGWSGITSVTGSGGSDTITGSGATYNLTTVNGGNSGSLSWTSFENISDASGGLFNLSLASNDVSGTATSGGAGPASCSAVNPALCANLNSDVDITLLNVSVGGMLLLTGNANSWNLTGPVLPAGFGASNPNANVFFNGACVGGPACGTVITIVGSIGATVSQAATQALQDATDTDSVQKQIDYGFAGDVGMTPPMDHRIDDTGISTPHCFEESRDGEACRAN